MRLGPATSLFLTPLIPSVPQDAFCDALQHAGWQQVEVHKESPCAFSEKLSFAHETNRDAATLSRHSQPGVMKQEGINIGSRSEYGSDPGSDSRSGSREQSMESAPPLWFVFKKVWASSLNGSECTCYLAMVPGAFCECIHAAQAGIAMAGTATEQLVRGKVWCQFLFSLCGCIAEEEEVLRLRINRDVTSLLAIDKDSGTYCHEIVKILSDWFIVCHQLFGRRGWQSVKSVIEMHV